MPGPMFAVTVTRGYRSPYAGTLTALGHAVVEIPLMLVIYFGLATFFEIEGVKIGLGIVGGLGLLYLGTSMFRARVGVVEGIGDLPYNSVVAGIATSVFNPYFLLWWATIGASLVMSASAFGITGLALFAVVHLFCDFAWLTLVSAVVYKTGHLWNRWVHITVFTVCSLLLIGFGVWFITAAILQI